MLALALLTPAPALVTTVARSTSSHRSLPLVAVIRPKQPYVRSLPPVAAICGEPSVTTPLNILIVECYDAAGMANLASVGCRRASDVFCDMLHDLMPVQHPCAVTVIEPCGDDFVMPSPDEIGQFDGVVWTGSSLTIHDDVPEVKRQIALARHCYEASVPQYGSCWGLQISAAAAGLVCEANPRGREHGIGRDITLTPEGLIHPLFDGTRRKFDVVCAHTDHVSPSWALSEERLNGCLKRDCPPGVEARVLAGNEWSPVQALAVRVGGGEFWSTQYHAELQLRDVARLMKTPFSRRKLVEQGSFASEEELLKYSEELQQICLDPSNTELRECAPPPQL